MNFGTSIDQKLNHAWNYSSIMVAYSGSIFQLKVRVETQKYRRKKKKKKGLQTGANNKPLF